MKKKILKKMKVRSALPLWILLTLCVLVLCVQAAFAQADATGVTKDEIKIGVFAPLTGTAAVYGKAAHLADAVFRRINEDGGIHGRKIVPIVVDTFGDPIKGVAAIKRLIYQDKVFMLHGGMVSNVLLAAKKEIIKTKIPMISFACANYNIFHPIEKNIFSGAYTSIGVSRTMADFAMSKPGVKRVGIIKHSDEWAKSFYEPIMEYLKTKYNIVPAVDVTIERGVSDATPQILKLKQAKLDIILAITYVESTSTIIRDAFKLGLKVPIVGSSGIAVDEQYARVGIPEAMEQVFAPYWYKYPFDHPEMVKWQALLNKYYPTDKFDMFAALGVGGTIAVIEALKKAGPDLTREKFIDAVETLSIDKWAPLPFPMATPIEYSPDDHIGIEQMASSVMSGGKVAVVYNWNDYLKLKK